MNNWWNLIGRTRHTCSGIATIMVHIENPRDLNDTDVPTKESSIKSQTQNTKETRNERAEEQRTQSNDNDHETHQLDPTSREATITTTDEPQKEERRPRQRKINTVCNFYKKKSLVDTA